MSNNKLSYCKRHFIAIVMRALRKELKTVYRCPEKVFASMDFYGTGSIDEGSFMKSVVV